MAVSSPPASPATAGGRVTTVVTETVAGWHALMTVDGYSNLMAMEVDGCISSGRFRAGGHTWYIEYFAFGLEVDEDAELTVRLKLDRPDANDEDEVNAQYKLALLDRAGEIIFSYQGFKTFSGTERCTEVQEANTTHLPHLLGDSFQIRFEVTVVKEITAARPPDLPRHLGGLLASQVGADATFQVGGELFAAHRCVLAARSAVFMAELFGPGAAAAAAAPVRVDGVEPRVFRALLHFVYTDSLPEVDEGDDDGKVAMARGLLAAADRFGVERLKLICGDVLCNHIDARTAMDLLELAVKHGCPRLTTACIKVIKDLLAKVAPSSSPIRKRQKKLSQA